MKKCKTIAFTLSKGGVGKTTTTLNLGAALAVEGYRVCLVDNDPQGNLGIALGVNATALEHSLATLMLCVLEGYMPDVESCIVKSGSLDLIPTSQKLNAIEKRLIMEKTQDILSDAAVKPEHILKTVLSELQENYDYILIDCAPSLGMLTINALAASDSVILPMEAHYLSYEALGQTLNLINRVKSSINHALEAGGILLTKYQHRTSLCRSIKDTMYKTYGETVNIFAEPIPYSIKAAEQTVHEILAGHNRVEAMKKLSRRDVPAIIRQLDDDQAALVVVNTNLKQREKLLPSEKAFAYKMQMEVLRNRGIPTNKYDDLASYFNALKESAQNEHEEKLRDVVADANGVDRNEIQRYMRLVHLLPELLELVDEEKLPVMAGYELSFLDRESQRIVFEYFFCGSSKDKLTVKNAEAIRAAYKAQKSITANSLYAILHKSVKKRGPVTYTFSHKSLMKEYNLPDKFDFSAFVHEKLKENFGER